MRKEGEFWIDFAAPLTGKVDKLLEFLKEHRNLGPLDRECALHWMEELDGMRVTRFTTKIARKANVATWHLCISINNAKEFKGNGPDFEDALLAILEDIVEFFDQELAC